MGPLEVDFIMTTLDLAHWYATVVHVSLLNTLITPQISPLLLHFGQMMGKVSICWHMWHSYLKKKLTPLVLVLVRKSGWTDGTHDSHLSMDDLRVIVTEGKNAHTSTWICPCTPREKTLINTQLFPSHEHSVGLFNQKRLNYWLSIHNFDLMEYCKYYFFNN